MKRTFNNRNKETHAAGSELLENGVEAAVKNGCVTDCDRRSSPDELDRVEQRIHVVMHTFHYNTTTFRHQPPLDLRSAGRCVSRNRFTSLTRLL